MSADRAHPVVVISQARTGSSRLPGKVLREVAGEPLLAHHVARLGRVERADAVVVATTEQPEDGAIVELCERLGVPCFRGSEHDVLARYHGAALVHGAGTVVRVTSDCPLIDPEVVDGLIAHLLEHREELDYVNNFEGAVRTYPLGFEAEVFSFAVLDRAFQEATEPLDREHVTPFIWRQPDRFRLHSVPFERDVSHLRLTVDTPEDLQLITRVLESVEPRSPDFRLADVLELLEAHPDWVRVNQDVKHKYYG